ncbi:MAG: hypothetical protein R3C11_13225 [Planctomycetaceae bacterium]
MAAEFESVFKVARSIKTLSGILTILFLLSGCSARSAHSSGNLLRIFQVERDVIFLKPLTEQVELADQSGRPLDNPGVGYYYKAFTILRINFWTWNGRFVLVSDQGINPNEKELKKLISHKEFKSLSVPWRYRIPTGLVIVVLGIIGLILYNRSRPTFADLSEEILSDSRYEDVLAQMKEEQLELEEWIKTEEQQQESFHEELQERQSAIISNAINKLEAAGIDRLEAEQNLRMVMEYLSYQEEDAETDEG